MFKPSVQYADSMSFSRFDTQHLLSPGSPHLIELDDKVWRTAEHYYQANKFTNNEYMAQIANCETPEAAYKLGNRWFKRKRENFKQLRPILMTRALYTKANMYPELKALLLDSGERLIAETTQYDPYWGIGRDQRGGNRLGRIWMDIRKKLAQETEGGPSE